MTSELPITVLEVRPVNNDRLRAKVICRYGELEIRGITVFDNGSKGLQVVWPSQRPKEGWSKWDPIVVPSPSLRKIADAIILQAVKATLDAL